MHYPRIILAGVNSGVGKTTLAMGLIAALKKRGLKVQPFKVGPDYIDPSYHTLVAGIPSRNLDSWMLSDNALLELFQERARFSDISVVEGVMGLYDGIKDKEEGSSSHLAKLTKSPVILIVDASSMSRSAAAVVLGFKEFDRDVNIRAVILNNIRSPSHYKSIKPAIETKTGLPVLGFLPKDKNLTLLKRHLGLIPANEKAVQNGFTKRLAGLIEENIDVEKVIKISQQAQKFPEFEKRIFGERALPKRVTIAIAKDAAFNFYYQDNLDILGHYGANLIEFSPLKDKKLPAEANGVYIGGGFPELFAAQLSKNSELKRDIFAKAKSGMPLYAECGGLMYLARDLVDFNKRRFPMAGIFDISVKMAEKLQGLGYVNVDVLKKNILSNRGCRMKAHIFHWSYFDELSPRNNFAYRLRKAHNNILQDGLVKWNVLASYAHLHFASDPELAKNFIRSCLL